MGACWLVMAVAYAIVMFGSYMDEEDFVWFGLKLEGLGVLAGAIVIVAKWLV